MNIEKREQLPELLKELNLPLIVAEVGVAEGLHAELLMKNGIEKLYLIDRWEHADIKGDSGEPEEWHNTNYNRVVEVMKPYGDKALILKGNSSDMCEWIPDNSLGMVYIDADHSYEGCLADLERWYPKVIDGGVIVGHDFLNMEYGVNKAVNEFVSGRFRITVIPENEPNNASFYFIKTQL